MTLSGECLLERIIPTTLTGSDWKEQHHPQKLDRWLITLLRAQTAITCTWRLPLLSKNLLNISILQFSDISSERYHCCSVANGRTRLISPDIQGMDTQCLRFFYHMHVRYLFMTPFWAVLHFYATIVVSSWRTKSEKHQRPDAFYLRVLDLSTKRAGRIHPTKVFSAAQSTFCNLCTEYINFFILFVEGLEE